MESIFNIKNVMFGWDMNPDWLPQGKMSYKH